MRKLLLNFLTAIMLCCITALTVKAQTVLIDHHFQSNALPAGVTSDGVISPTKAADGVCSQGMIQVNSGGYLQADVSSCSNFRVHMKSTSSSARAVRVKYKKEGAADYTIATSTLSVLLADSINLTRLFPDMVSNIPLSVRIEPINGNIQIHDLYVAGSTSLSNAAEITEFKLPGQIGSEVINSANGTIAINVPLEANLSSVTPSKVTISSQATISPAAASPQNFSGEVTYTVTAQNGTTVKTWKVNVTKIASAAKEITTFKLLNEQIGEAVINSAAGIVTITVPISANISNIAPVTLALSPFATVAPAANTQRDFTQPVSYTVTAQDNSTKTWQIIVNKVDPNAVFFDYQAEDAEFTGKKDNSHANYTGTGFIDFLADGENSIIFTVCQQQAGTQTAKFRYSIAKDDIRKGNLYVNDAFIKTLDFTRTATFDDWSEETAALTLLMGVNRIKITWDSTDGPNLDKLSLTGAPCSSYTVNVTSTNSGKVTLDPVRAGNKYFEGETVSLSAESTPALVFEGWSGDLTGNANPAHVTVNSNKNITANFRVVPTYKLNVNVDGIGEVSLSPAGGEYAENTVVTLTARSVLGSTFQGWQGDAGGTNAVTTVTMNSVKTVRATFTSAYTFNFEKVVGFASAAGDGFNGPAKGGQGAPDSVIINGPSEFNKLCETLYNRQQAYTKNITTGGIKKAPLVILLKAGIYDGTQTLSTNGAKIFGNSMLDIPEQGDLTFIGEKNVVFKIGINVKRSYNLLIRNISFQDYYDDGINIGEPETHHIWIDHCTIGNPTAMPADHEHPDGGIDVKTGASYVTISWCKYQNSWKTGLIGHSDNNGAQDNGRLKVTHYNNWFYHTNSRNPRVRFGQVHVLNCLSESVMLYGIAASNSSQVFAENNFYLNTDWPMYADRTTADFKAVYGNNTDDAYTSKTGNYPAAGLRQTGNEYDDSGLPVITSQINPAMLNPGGRSIKFDEFNPNAVFNPRTYYDYDALPASVIRTIVPIYAGADKVTFSSNAALPLTLLSFNAGYDNNQVNLWWSSLNEVNTGFFEVERSTDGKTFTTISTVTAKATPGANSYDFIDPNPLFSEVAYYRLKIVDKDGAFRYSSISVVNSRLKGKIALYPNPAHRLLELTHNRANAKAAVEIFTMDGRKVITQKLMANTTKTSVDVSGLSAGTYLLHIVDGKDLVIKKFVKQ